MATTIEGVDFSAQITRLLALETWRNNRVASGLLASAPTTQSTQGSGAVPASWRYNSSVGFASIDGHILTMSLDDVIPNGVMVDVLVGNAGVDNSHGPTIANGQSIKAALVACTADFDGTIYTFLSTVHGAAATTGAEQPPSAATIRAQLIASAFTGNYVRVAPLTLHRTGDTTVTQSQDNTWRDF